MDGLSVSHNPWLPELGDRSLYLMLRDYPLHHLDLSTQLKSN